MKRALSLILAAVMILAAAPVAGEEYVKNLTNEQLQMLIAYYSSALLEKTGDGFTIYPGIYNVGIDIQPMAYRIEHTDQLAVVYVYANADAFDNSLPYFSHTFTEETPIVGRVGLQQGQIIEIRAGTVRLAPYTGIGE